MDAACPDPFVAQLAALCRTQATRAKWVIVPSHAVGRMLGERLVLEGTNWANLRFTTPFSLALDTAAPLLVERGLDPVGDDIGPALIMRLLHDLPPQVPAYFRTLASHPEMGRALFSALRDLRLAGIDAVSLPAGAFTSAEKHQELQALLAAYECWLTTARRADPADVFREARLHPDACPVKSADALLILPNIIWPPLISQFLEALPSTPTVPAVPRIPGLARPRRLEQAPHDERPTTSPLAFLMQPEGPASAPDPITLFRAGGSDAEIEEVFRRILHAPGGPLPLDRVEIACASPDEVCMAWQKAVRYDWPVTLEPGIPVAVTRPARALLGWCDWIERGYPASALRRLLQSGDVRLDIDGGPGSGQAASLLLRSGATWGPRTYATSLATLAASAREQADDPEVEGARKASLLQRATHATRLAAWIDALFASLPDAPAVGSGSDLTPRPLQGFVAAARDFVRRWAATTSELDAKAAAAVDSALAELGGLGPVDCAAAYAIDLVRAAIDGLGVAASRARPGHLHVSLLPHAGYAGRAHTFVVGLEEGRAFPALIEDAVLLDAERAAIHSALATSQDRVAESVHAVVSRLAVLPPHVCLSFSCRDVGENRETFPSWPLLQALRIIHGGDDDATYDDLAAHLGEPKSVVPPAPDQALDDVGWWLANLARAGRADCEPLFKTFAALGRGAAARGARERDTFTAFDGFVPKAGSALDPRTSESFVSPTGLEKAAECPFRYFLEQALGLEPIEEEEPGDDAWLDAATRGTLLHQLFADVMRELRRRHERADPKKHLDWLLARADDRLAALRDEMPPPSPHVFEHERRQIARDLEMFLHVEAEAVAKGTEPIAFEVRFGSRHGDDPESAAEPIGQAAPIEVRLGAASFLLGGRIDRVDRLPNGDYEVVDYKTGSFYRPKYKGVFRGGRQLQHALYALAAEPLLRQQVDRSARVVSGRYLFPTFAGGGDDRHIPRPAAAAVEAVLAGLFDTLKAGGFVATPKKEDCKFCEYGGACGTDHGRARLADPIGRAEAKINNDQNTMLRAFRQLRKHD